MIDLCIIAENYYPILTGAGERFRRYSPGLKKRGINLRIVTINVNNRPEHERIDDIPIHRFNITKEPNQIFTGTGSVSAVLLKSAIKYFKETDDLPDIIHILTHTIQGVNSVFKARFYGIPCVNSITLMPLESNSLFGHFKNISHYFIRYLPFNLIISNTRILTNRIIKLGISPKRIETISNGVDLNQFRPVMSLKEKKIVRKKLGIDAKSEIILYAGYIVPRKGIDLLIGAWPKIIQKRKNVRLILIGPYEKEVKNEMIMDGYQSYFNKITNMMNDLKENKRISFIGEVQNVASYMRAADVFVFPSRQEGSPNALMEAMASGLPCVTTPFSGFSSELGSSGKEFLMSSFSCDSIAQNVNDILSNHSKMIKLSKAARSFAEEHFDVERSLDKYAEIYRKLSMNR